MKSYIIIQKTQRNIKNKQKTSKIINIKLRLFGDFVFFSEEVGYEPWTCYNTNRCRCGKRNH